MRPHVNIKGARSISRPALVPLEAADSDLEGVHPTAVVLQLLVSVLRLVESVRLIFEADAEPTELRVHSDEICGENRLNHEIEPVCKVIH